MTLREAFVEGFRTEQTWNAKVIEDGHAYARLPVPRVDYRARRSVRFAFNIMREKLAARLAPWIVFDEVLDEHGLCDYRMMTRGEVREILGVEH